MIENMFGGWGFACVVFVWAFVAQAGGTDEEITLLKI
jgi:hypothetical protein